MPNPRKIKVIEELERISPYDLDGKSLEGLIGYLEELKKEYGPDALFDWDPHYCYPYESSPSPRFYIKRYREETDEEFRKRLETEQKAADAKRERDLAEFERLKKVFGDK